MTQPTRKVSSRATWKNVLAEHAPLLLPVAHDALTARLIEFAGYPAYQAGGFELMGTRPARPGVDRTRYWEHRAVVWDAIAASDLPVLVDVHGGCHDAKHAAQTVRDYEAIGASAIALSDQARPAGGGHASPRPAACMESMLRAAAAARRSPDTFLLARTSAGDADRLDDALRRAERYLSAGADGVHVDPVRRPEDLERTGRALKGAPLATTILADGGGGGGMPWVAPAELHRLGFSMILYPTTIIFGVTRAIQRTLKGLRHVGRCARAPVSHATPTNP